MKKLVWATLAALLVAGVTPADCYAKRKSKKENKKEQVADMLQRMLHLNKDDMPVFMDATDGLAAAYCHYLQMGRPAVEKSYRGWKDFIAKNPDKVKG